MYHNGFIHPSVDGHIGCFHVLAIVYSTAMNRGLRVSFWSSVFVLFGYILRSGIGGSYDNSNFSHTSVCEMVSHYISKLHFPDDYWSEIFFMYLFATHVMKCQVVCWLLNGVLNAHRLSHVSRNFSSRYKNSLYFFS